MVCRCNIFSCFCGEDSSSSSGSSTSELDNLPQRPENQPGNTSLTGQTHQPQVPAPPQQGQQQEQEPEPQGPATTDTEQPRDREPSGAEQEQEQDWNAVSSDSSDNSVPAQQPIARTTSAPAAYRQRDPPMEPAWLCRRGARIVRWIADPREPNCPIPRNTLTFAQLRQQAIIQEERRGLPRTLEHVPEAFEHRGQYRFFGVNFEHATWVGITGPNMIVLQNIARDQLEVQNQDPHTSDIALALYNRDHAMENLRYVFVTGILNWQTRTYVRQDLCGGVWPPEVQPQRFEHGTPEFDGLLGTRIGRTVGYLVLGGFARGTRRIARVLVWSVGIGQFMDLRFDIEAAPASE